MIADAKECPSVVAAGRECAPGLKSGPAQWPSAFAAWILVTMRPIELTKRTVELFATDL
jgi:hypothetical protein